MGEIGIIHPLAEEATKNGRVKPSYEQQEDCPLPRGQARNTFLRVAHGALAFQDMRKIGWPQTGLEVLGVLREPIKGKTEAKDGK